MKTHIFIAAVILLAASSANAQQGPATQPSPDEFRRALLVHRAHRVQPDRDRRADQVPLCWCHLRQVDAIASGPQAYGSGRRVRALVRLADCAWSLPSSPRDMSPR
jgi:hypothetical protein